MSSVFPGFEAAYQRQHSSPAALAARSNRRSEAFVRLLAYSPIREKVSTQKRIMRKEDKSAVSENFYVSSDAERACWNQIRKKPFFVQFFSPRIEIETEIWDNFNWINLFSAEKNRNGFLFFAGGEYIYIYFRLILYRNFKMIFLS